jgi:hypothetical protein
LELRWVSVGTVILPWVGEQQLLLQPTHPQAEVHSWVVKLEQSPAAPIASFLVGVAPPSMDLNKSLGEEGCGIGV